MSKRGFSLIELLVSSSLILFLLTGAAQLIIFSLQAKKSAEFHTAAASLASLKLEFLKSLPFENSELQGGPYEDFAAAKTSPAVLCRTWQIEDVDENIKKVTMEISSSSNPRQKATFILLLSRELEF